MALINEDKPDAGNNTAAITPLHSTPIIINSAIFGIIFYPICLLIFNAYSVNKLHHDTRMINHNSCIVDPSFRPYHSKAVHNVVVQMQNNAKPLVSNIGTIRGSPLLTIENVLEML